ERKRVSIAETTLSGSPLQCWDNSTCGLDSATALGFSAAVDSGYWLDLHAGSIVRLLDFIRTLRLLTPTQVTGSTCMVAIYQVCHYSDDLSPALLRSLSRRLRAHIMYAHTPPTGTILTFFRSCSIKASS
ncbi:hypothetical protein B0H14DRAFT_2367769, partial [Mycena olivaceomarginata]